MRYSRLRSIIRKLQDEGFSLIQLSVIVLAAGLVAAAVIPDGKGDSKAQRYQTTMKRLQKIEEATIAHMAIQGRRPCPASGEYYPSHANFGREDGSAGDCADSGATDGILTPFNDANVVAGTVPTTSLHLPMEYYFDGWGRPFTYVVDKRATEPLECVQITGSGDVKLYDSDGGTQVDQTMYALISHGPDGHGAFQTGGSSRADRLDSGSTNANQQNNAGVSGFTGFDIGGSNPASFVNEWVKRESDMGAGTYDDVTHYIAKYKNRCCVGNICGESIAALIPSPPASLVLNGIDDDDNSGWSVSSGDVNGDGYADVIIGAQGADPSGASTSGETYVVFGKANGWAPSLDLSSLNGSNGVVINGIDAGDYSGYSVSSGDVNGDGYMDVIIGAYTAAPNGSDSGETYVVFGKASGWATSLNLSTLDGSNGVVINGIDGGDYSGTSVSSGDVNGDGYADVIIGAYAADPNGIDRSGETYVVFGKASGWAASLNLSTLDGSNGVAINGFGVNYWTGTSVSSGDVNGDGYMDVIIGAYRATTNGISNTGQTYVVFGKPSGWDASLELSTLNGNSGVALNGIDTIDWSSYSVSSGDVNGDGNADVIIGAFRADPNGSDASGETYVVFGKASGWAPSLDLSSLNGSNGVVINGIDAGDYSGYSVSSGDVNGDGYMDVIIGAYRADPNGSSSGETYIVFGKASGWAASLDLNTLNGSNGFILNGIDVDDFFGRRVYSGDINGDGYADVVIGADGADPNGSNSGATYVVFGKASGWQASHNIADLLAE